MRSSLVGVFAKQAHSCLAAHDPAVLRANMKINDVLPPGSGPEPAQSNRFLKETGSPDLPPDPPREEGRQEQKKSVHKYSWDWVSTAAADCVQPSL